MKNKSLFLKCYGKNPKLKILDFLIVHQDLDYSMKEISKKSKVSYTLFKQLWKDMVNRRIVNFTRTIGKAKLYQLNTENPEVKQFEKFYWTVIDQEINRLEEITVKEKIPMIVPTPA